METAIEEPKVSLAEAITIANDTINETLSTVEPQLTDELKKTEDLKSDESEVPTVTIEMAQETAEGVVMETNDMPVIETPQPNTSEERSAPFIEEFSSINMAEGEVASECSNEPIIEEPKENVSSDETPVESIQIQDVSEENEVVVGDETTSINDSTEITDLHLQIDDSTGLSTSTEDEMILEETTGEYVLASSVGKSTITVEEDAPEAKKAKINLDDKDLAKLIEENIKSGEFQPGEQFVILTSDEKGNTKEVVLTHTQTTTDDGVTLQHVVDESGDVYLIETVSTDEEEEEEPVAPKIEKQSRKSPRKMQIPNHVLGRNIVNPADDSFRNGKAPPKPRLGVKVPYRNLTSQIVSKQEIAEEILERSRRFTRENTRGPNMFAKKITQNLAKKLAPRDKKGGIARPRGRPPLNRLELSIKKESDKLDNSDLLAILEGDGEPEPKATKEEKEDPPEEMTVEKERELALKQLSELPDDPPEVVQKKPKEERVRNLRREEPPKSRFSGNVPLKTYARKRKVSEDSFQPANSKPIIPKEESPSPEPTTSTVKNPNSSPENPSTYVTKSSRVIKRKVIWDPDEAPRRSLKLEPKQEEKKPEVKRVESAKKLPNILHKPRILRRRSDDVKEKQADVDTNDNEKLEEEKEEKPSTPVKYKRPTEVSKLLMDEGAVNMLYSIKSEDKPTTKTRRNISLQSKTNALLSDLNDLKTNTPGRASPRALRKKETMATPTPISKPQKKLMCPPTPSPISRQKSKDSNRSSIHSPPPSPGHAYGGVESRIIRRHSSSSYSSMGEEDDGDEKRNKKQEGRTRRRTESIPNAPDSPRKKPKLEVSPTDKNSNDHFEKLVEIKLNPSEKYDKFSTLKVNELNKLVQIDLQITNEDDNNVYMTNELMTEMIEILGDLEKDKDVNVVLVTSTGSDYCSGINYKTLVNSKETPRKTNAKKLARSTEEFFLALAKFPKVLVAGIHRACVGIGVTMLPLFDMIIANAEATFFIPNAKLGCIVEGGSLLLLPHLSQNVLINELLYSAETLGAEDALKLGLVTKILPSGSYAKELLSTVKGVSDKSAQFMVATKKQLRKRMIAEITSSIKDEIDNLIEQWISDECQKSFADENVE